MTPYQYCYEWDQKTGTCFWSKKNRIQVYFVLPETSACGPEVNNINSWDGPGGSLSQVAGLLNNTYKPITNTTWVRARLCKLQIGCTRLAAASDEVYQLLAHGRWYYPGTLASSTAKTGRHDIAEIYIAESDVKN